MTDGRVYIAETQDPDDLTFLSGRFAAHWESSEPPYRFLDGPQDASAEDAIAWGREHADVVLIRLGDSDRYHSAGPRRRADLPAWPAGGIPAPRRRDPGFAYLDRTPDDPPIQWSVTLSGRLPDSVDPGTFVEAVHHAAEAHPAAFAVQPAVAVDTLEIDATSVPEDDWLVDEIEFVAFRVSASTYGDAERLASDVLEAGIEAGFTGIDPDEGWTMYGVEVQPAAD